MDIDIDFKQPVPRECDIDRTGIDAEIGLGIPLKLLFRAALHFTHDRRIVFLLRIGLYLLLEPVNIIPDIRLIRPVVQILGRQHTLMGIGSHIPGQKPLGYAIADRVTGCIPSIIRCQLIHHLILIQPIYQGIVRSIRKSHIDEADRNILGYRLFYLRKECPRRIEHDGEIFKIARFPRRCRKRRIDGQQQVRFFLVRYRSADSFDMSSNGLANGLPVITRYGLFPSAERINDRHPGMIVVEVIIRPRNEQQAQLIGPGERPETGLRDVSTCLFQILRL